MAYASSLRHPAAYFGLPAWFTRKLREIHARRERYQVYFQTVDALSRASDREIADLGIHREEISAVARNHAGL